MDEKDEGRRFNGFDIAFQDRAGTIITLFLRATFKFYSPSFVVFIGFFRTNATRSRAEETLRILRCLWGTLEFLLASPTQIRRTTY